MCDSKAMGTLRESLLAYESIQESLTQIIHTRFRVPGQQAIMKVESRRQLGSKASERPECT